MPDSPPCGKDARLFLLAQAIATRTSGFFEIKGAGIGDKATNLFMQQIRNEALKLFGSDYSEKRVCGNAKFALDFYFPDEAIAVEIALSLRNPGSEYERDILKCLLAIDEGCPIRRLVFITKPGGHLRQQAPGAQAIAAYALKKFGLDVDVLELFADGLDVPAVLDYVAQNQVTGRK
jgi:hypothetical protein